MTEISQSKEREIIRDFAQNIQDKREKISDQPMTTIIDFRTDSVNKRPREIWLVPIELLMFRKDNGRIASDVLDYEATGIRLKEETIETQKKLGEFLAEKNPVETEDLEKMILHHGQRDPAIITCDGFLINGNRRKMVLEKLFQKTKQDKFKWMKVVILPDKGEEGGPPTLFEIEKLENRYQFQKEGKAEYYGFDRAISIRRKNSMGLSLEEQIKDDPRYAEADEKEIKRAVKKWEEEYLNPLICVDKYLEQSDRRGQYRAISAGSTDRGGRWYAFVDLSKRLEKTFKDPNKCSDIGVKEEEIGAIETAAYHIIRFRDIPDIRKKTHEIMRDLDKYCGTPEGKKCILKIAEEVTQLTEDEYKDDETGEQLSSSEAEDKWKAKNKQTIIWQLKKADEAYRAKKDKETPLDLIEAALKKLNHGDMNLSDLTYDDYARAKKIIWKIKERAADIEGGIKEMEKKAKELSRKK